MNLRNITDRMQKVRISTMICTYDPRRERDIIRSRSGLKEEFIF
jgi:hypothetical protein